jgi:hypothetical protein
MTSPNRRPALWISTIGVVTRTEHRAGEPHSRQGHGSRACYTLGCREPQCVAANTAYQKDYRDGLRGTLQRRMGGYRIGTPPRLPGL